MRKIGIVGSGHVGLVTGACFAKLGNEVICADQDINKIKKLKKLEIPFYEPGLEEIVKEVVKKNKLFFTTSIKKLVENSEIIFITVGTPAAADGRADLSFVEQVTIEIAKALGKIKGEGQRAKGKGYRLIVEKSTVPVLTGEWVRKTMELLAPTEIEFDIAANPEFLREGNAVRDFLFPDRIVVGVESKRAEKIFREIYASIKSPIVFTDIKSAELIKHASNSFLALKISYINAVSQICERVGGDVEKISEGMGYDKRIGKGFLKAGAGYGGSCFPKDIAAFISLAEEIGYNFDLLKDVQKINKEQKFLIVKKARELLWNLKNKEIGILGLAFKPDTDDIRESPALEIIGLLKQEGVFVKCYDPEAIENTKMFFPDIFYGKNPYEVVKDSHLLIFLTEWDEFKKLDFKKVKKLMKTPYIIDGRNFLDYKEIQKTGLIYKDIGRNR